MTEPQIPRRLAELLIHYLDADEFGPINDWLEESNWGEYRVPKDLAERMRKVSKILPDWSASLANWYMNACEPELMFDIDPNHGLVYVLSRSRNDLVGEDWQEKVYEQADFLKNQLAILGGFELEDVATCRMNSV